MTTFHRRHLLATGAFIIFNHATARAGIIHGAIPWEPGAGAPPERVLPGPWRFFTPAEAQTIEAIVDRMIPPDPETPGGKDAGCAVYIDRQLAGPFGRAEGLYMSGPFKKGTKTQGAQSPLTPAEEYRHALRAIDDYSKAAFAGRTFVNLAAADQDTVITALEKGTLTIPDVDSKAFFGTLLKNVREGFFADPIYGGNRDMAGWKMIGFPGARYDYSDWIDKHNQPYPRGPIAIGGAPSWTVR